MSITRTSLDWGVPVPWAEGHVFYVWYDALDQLRHGDRLRHRRRAVRRRGGRTSTTSSARRSSASTACTGRRCCWPRASTRRTASTSTAGCCWAARSCRKTVHGAAKLTDIAPARLVDDFGVDGFRYHFLRDAPFGPDGDFSYERMVDRYNSRPRQQPRQPAVARRHRRRQEVRRHRPGAAARQPARAGRRRGRHARRPRRGSASQPSRRARRHVAADPRDQRLPRGQRAVEGRARARASTPCSATRSRRCASSPSSPRRRSRRRRRPIWERIGLPGAVADQRVPDDVAWGGYPGGLAGRPKGAPLFPAHQGLTGRSLDSTRTATSRPTTRSAERRRRGRGRPASPRWSPSARDAGVVARRRIAVAAAPRRRVGHGRPAPPRRQQRRRHDRRPARRPAASSPSASAGSTTTTTTRRATSSGRRSPRRSRWPTSSACRS